MLPALLLFLASCVQKETEITDTDRQFIGQMNEAVDSGTNFLGAYAIAKDLYDRGIRDPEVLFNLAFTADKVRPDPSFSISLYRKCLARFEDEPAAFSDIILKVKTYFYLGYLYEKMRKPDKADDNMNSAFAQLDRLNKASKLDDGVGFYLLAYCYARHKQHELSLEFYQKALDWFEQNRPDSYYLRGCFYNIGLYYYNAMDYKNAVVYWRQAWEKEPASGYFKEIYRKSYDLAREAQGLD